MTWEEVEEAQLKGEGGGASREPAKKLTISIPQWCGKWVVSMDEYADGVVGAKSKNLAGVDPRSEMGTHLSFLIKGIACLFHCCSWHRCSCKLSVRLPELTSMRTTYG